MMQYVEFDSGANTLRGMLHLPEGQRPRPCVMFCHGFTGQRIEAHFLFVQIARQLERLGLASLRFDFGGSGESDGEFAEMTMSGEVDDAEAALEFLRRHPAIDADRIGVVGLSLGGGVTGLLAGRRGADIRAVALLSAVAEPARILSIIRTGKFEGQLAQRDYIDWDGLMVRRPFLQDLERLFPAKALAGYAGPVLIIHGAEDAVCPPSEAETFHQARAGSPGTTRLEMIDGADHTYNTLAHTGKVCQLLEQFFADALR
jgi:dipeptidyl aminopeptidase/acylaminoacyl peptidase